MQRKSATPISYYALLAIVNTLSRLPFSLLYALSDILFLPFYHLIRYRSKIVRQNLTESFPHKNTKQIRRKRKEILSRLSRHRLRKLQTAHRQPTRN